MNYRLLKLPKNQSVAVRLDCPYEFLSHLETEIPEEDIVFRKHVKVAALAVKGYSPDDIAQVAKYSKPHILNILNDYNQRGFYALLDNRRKYEANTLRKLFLGTAQRLNMGLEQEHFRAWFSAAGQTLPASQQRAIESSSISQNQNYLETTTRDESNDSGWIPWALGIGIIVLIALFSGASNNRSPYDTPHAPSAPIQPFEQQR